MNCLNCKHKVFDFIKSEEKQGTCNVTITHKCGNTSVSGIHDGNKKLMLTHREGRSAGNRCGPSGKFFEIAS